MFCDEMRRVQVMIGLWFCADRCGGQVGGRVGSFKVCWRGDDDQTGVHGGALSRHGDEWVMERQHEDDQDDAGAS